MRKEPPHTLRSHAAQAIGGDLATSCPGGSTDLQSVASHSQQQQLVEVELKNQQLLSALKQKESENQSLKQDLELSQQRCEQLARQLEEMKSINRELLTSSTELGLSSAQQQDEPFSHRVKHFYEQLYVSDLRDDLSQATQSLAKEKSTNHSLLQRCRNLQHEADHLKSVLKQYRRTTVCKIQQDKTEHHPTPAAVQKEALKKQNNTKHSLHADLDKLEKCKDFVH